MRRAVLTFALGFLAVLLMACLQWAPERPYAAQSFCLASGQAFTVYDSSSWNAADSAGTPAHEARHLEQYRRFGSCAAVHRFYRTAYGHVQMEAEAYGVSFCMARKAGLDSETVYLDMRQRLRNDVARVGLGDSTTTDVAFAAYAGAC